MPVPILLGVGLLTALVGTAAAIKDAEEKKQKAREICEVIKQKEDELQSALKTSGRNCSIAYEKLMASRRAVERNKSTFDELFVMIHNPPEYEEFFPSEFTADKELEAMLRKLFNRDAASKINRNTYAQSTLAGAAAAGVSGAGAAIAGLSTVASVCTAAGAGMLVFGVVENLKARDSLEAAVRASDQTAELIKKGNKIITHMNNLTAGFTNYASAMDETSLIMGDVLVHMGRAIGKRTDRHAAGDQKPHWDDFSDHQKTIIIAAMLLMGLSWYLYTVDVAVVDDDERIKLNTMQIDKSLRRKKKVDSLLNRINLKKVFKMDRSYEKKRDRYIRASEDLGLYKSELEDALRRALDRLSETAETQLYTLYRLEGLAEVLETLGHPEDIDLFDFGRGPVHILGGVDLEELSQRARSLKDHMDDLGKELYQRRQSVDDGEGGNCSELVAFNSVKYGFIGWKADVCASGTAGNVLASHDRLVSAQVDDIAPDTAGNIPGSGCQMLLERTVDADGKWYFLQNRDNRSTYDAMISHCKEIAAVARRHKNKVSNVESQLSDAIYEARDILYDDFDGNIWDCLNDSQRRTVRYAVLLAGFCYTLCRLPLLVDLDDDDAGLPVKTINYKQLYLEERAYEHLLRSFSTVPGHI